MNDNNNQITQTHQRISNINELLSLINEYHELLKEYPNLSKEEKLIKIERITEIESILRHGIQIDNNIVLQYIYSVREFIESLGLDYSLVEQKLSTMDLVIAPVELLDKGKLCNYGNYIAIDYSYAKFDENGNFVELNEPINGFFKHTITHELLHAISNKGFDYMDSFAEGLTDYFAHKISKSINVISDNYGYIERVFYMFGTMMNDNVLFKDYVTDINKMSSLHQFVSSLGISEEEFNNFKNMLDEYLKICSKSKGKAPELITIKQQIDYFIYNRIIMPYCLNNPDKAQEMVQIFFSQSETSLNDMCEIHFDPNSRRVN